MTDVIVVDDGSTDGTSSILQKIALDHPHIKVIGWKQNLGKGFALLEGFRYALTYLDFQALVTLDSDAQHSPEDIPFLIKAVLEGADMVIASRHFALMPPRSKFGNTLIAKLLQRIYDVPQYDTQSGYRAFSKALVEKLVRTVPGGRYETEFKCLLTALKEKFKIVCVPTKTIYINRNRSSHFSPVKDSFTILKTLWEHANV